MKPDKNLQDALFRSHDATEKNTQDQSQLNRLGKAENSEELAQSPPELTEKPVNVLRSWDTLRQLDETLEHRKDLPADETDNTQDKV